MVNLQIDVRVNNTVIEISFSSYWHVCVFVVFHEPSCYEYLL
jgi:hypothetical protein